MNTNTSSLNPFDVILERLNCLDIRFSELKDSITISPVATKERILKTREETKEIYHITDPTLNKRVADGKIIKIFMGRRVLFDLTDFLSVPGGPGK